MQDAGVDLGDAMDEASSAAAGRLQRLRPRLGSAAVAILVAAIIGASKLGCSPVLSLVLSNLFCTSTKY